MKKPNVLLSPSEDGKTLFRCPCPGCQKEREWPVRKDKNGNLFAICELCRGRVFGTQLIMNWVSKQGGLSIVQLEIMPYEEFADLMSRLP